MKVIGFITVMLIVYFIVPMGFPYEPTIVQSAVITLLLFVARFVLTEGITVKVEPQPFHTWRIVEDEGEDAE
ncbi:hypothetical protein [Niallia circulans]|uniref:hypothetical protein n=1 Tax=Niallia circulans TaxID=1397 RepID=UPI0015615D73|nr:hypothetical protein [Niallia circulans]NRG30740.1 hypothetical protein [Niallia circulans]